MSAAASQTTDDRPPARPEYADPVETEPHEPAELTGDDEPPPPAANMPEISDPDGDLEALEDRSMPIERLLWAENREGSRIEQVYVQKGLSWFGKLELYGLLGQAVKVVMEGENPLGVGAMLDAVQNPGKTIAPWLVNSMLPGSDTVPDRPEVTEEMELEAGKVMGAFAQVVSMAPELLSHAYCVALAIPKTHRNWAIEWAFPNMDDEMGKDILHTFIDQNWGVMEDFFVRELPKIMRRIVKARRETASDGPR